MCCFILRCYTFSQTGPSRSVIVSSPSIGMSESTFKKKSGRSQRWLSFYFRWIWLTIQQQVSVFLARRADKFSVLEEEEKKMTRYFSYFKQLGSLRASRQGLFRILAENRKYEASTRSFGEKRAAPAARECGARLQDVEAQQLLRARCVKQRQDGCIRVCSHSWIPVAAPLLAHPDCFPSTE